MQKPNEAGKKEAQMQRDKNLQYFIIASLVIVVLAIVIIASIQYREITNGKKNAIKKIEKAYSDLKATQAQLIQSEKMASLGELTAGIAHEIQNPLNFVNNFSEVNKELLTEIERPKLTKEIMNEVKAIAK